MTADAVRRIKESLPLPVLVGEYLTLRKMGQDWTTRCPFHDEKTASFHVHLTYYKCFGCGVHGDAIDFLAHMESVSKYSAIQRLSDRTGIPLDGKRPTRTQVAYDKDAQAFTDWWWRVTGERLALKLSEAVEGYCWSYIAEDQADDAGVAWRTHYALMGQARRHACLSSAMAQERAEWKYRMALDKETTEMMVKILEAVAC